MVQQIVARASRKRPIPLQVGVALYTDCGQTDNLSWKHALLAFAARGPEETAEARRRLLRACQIAVDLRVVPPLLWVCWLLFSSAGLISRCSPGPPP